MGSDIGLIVRKIILTPMFPIMNILGSTIGSSNVKPGGGAEV
jgi:hypothetical protein